MATFWRKKKNKKNKLTNFEVELVSPKQPKSGPPNNLNSCLTIITSYGEHSWYHSVSSKHNHIWDDFYNWFFNKPDSPYYMMYFKDGHELIQRDYILTFKINLITDME